MNTLLIVMYLFAGLCIAFLNILIVRDYYDEGDEDRTNAQIVAAVVGMFWPVLMPVGAVMLFYAKTKFGRKYDE